MAGVMSVGVRRVGTRVGGGLLGLVGLRGESAVRFGAMSVGTRVGVRRVETRVGGPGVVTSVASGRGTSGVEPVGVTTGGMSAGAGLVGRTVRRRLGRGATIRRFRKGSRVPSSIAA